MNGPIVCHRIPVNVQAWQVPKYDTDEWRKIEEWCNGTIIPPRVQPFKSPAFILVGKGSRVPAFEGDWVIKNSANEFYPVPALLFSQSYEIVQEVNAKWCCEHIGCISEPHSHLSRVAANPPLFTISVDGPGRWLDIG